MSIKTNYFDGGGLSYGASDLIAPWASLLNDGVFGVSAGDLNVLAHSPANLSVDVQIGQGIKNGYFINSDSIVNVAIGANTSGYNRIDTIVANIDTTNKITSITAVQGIPSSSPVTPTLTSNQLGLANILVGNNVSVINQNVITDVRQNVDLFGAQLAAKVNKNDFLNSLAGNGYQKLPGGLILQWCVLGVSVTIINGNQNTGNIAFPIAFPNLCFAVECVPVPQIDNNGVYICGASKTNSNFSFAFHNGPTAQTINGFVLAIGY